MEGFTMNSTWNELNDTQLRTYLNRERNPLREIPNEATSTVNPITGQEYHDSPVYLRKGDFHMILMPNEYMQAQLALARMEMRRGNISREQYDDFIGICHRAACVYKLSPDSITTVNELESAVELAETHKRKTKYGVNVGLPPRYDGSLSIKHLPDPLNLPKFPRSWD